LGGRALWAAVTWLALGCVIAAAMVGCGGDKGGGGASPTMGAGTRAPSVASATAATGTAAPDGPAVSTGTAVPGGTPAATGSAVADGTPAAPAVILARGDPSRRVVALTFDAGSDGGFTREILATLSAERVRATFSVTGAWAEANVGLLLSIAAEGHELINHSYSHRSFTGRSTGSAPLSADERRLELSRVETTVFRLTSRSTRPYFRPPYGDVDASVQRDAAAAGYGVIVMWTIDSLGWNGASADAIVERVLGMAEPGAIVIMHVGSDSDDAAALQRVIDGLRGAGYGFVTIDEMVAAPGTAAR